MTLATARRWLAGCSLDPEAKHRLLCFAWAGALPAIFSNWTIPGVEIIVVQLPGRHP
jgi:surfactin synthase thioesterase subunit